jgi:hypothetical protein
MAAPFQGTIPGLPSGNTIPQQSVPPPVNINRGGAQSDVHWKLSTIEPRDLKFKNFTVTGQMPIDEDGISYAMNELVSTASTYGIPHPFIQWIRGELEVISFNVVLFSRDSEEDISSMFEEMKRLKLYVPELKRIPICRFTYGNIISVKCMIKGLGEVKFARARTDGQARKITFRLTLHRYVPIVINEIDRNKKPKFSRMQTVSGDGRMYENIAGREYGLAAAIYGDRLRKLNRAEPFAVADGGATKVPRFDKISGDRIEPEFYGFRDSREDVANMLQQRMKNRNSLFLVT